MVDRISYHLHNYVLEHHIITEHQSGFQPKDSTVNQLVYIYNTIISDLDIGKDIRFIFCDISKAFDRVWHTGLLLKLKAYGVDGKLFKWFERYQAREVRGIRFVSFYDFSIGF